MKRGPKGAPTYSLCTLSGCRHLASRHRLRGDNVKGPYVCLDCGCEAGQDNYEARYGPVPAELVPDDA